MADLGDGKKNHRVLKTEKGNWRKKEKLKS